MLYQRSQIKDSDSITVSLDNTTNPPSLLLNSIDSRFGSSTQLPVSLLYNTENNTVIDKKVIVPQGKDFLINVINDDNSDITLDRNLNIVLDRDLDFKQTCEIKIYPNNATFNKKLDISMITNLESNVDQTQGFKLFNNTFELPIDNNLNPTTTLESIFTRWSSFPTIYPNNIKIRKISDNYFVVVELSSIQAAAFSTGDVILLENFKFVDVDLVTDISGQYTIIGEIENNELIFQVELESFKLFFDQININKGNQPTHTLEGRNFKQLSTIRVNTGYTIKITANDSVSSNTNERYLIEVLPLHNKNI